MPFVDDLVKHRSVSIVGMSKNAGKTESLNYILQRLTRDYELSVALTSIGIDGEKRDQVTQTDKPEISLSPGTIFITSEKHYLERRLTAEILDIANRRTALGRLITARAIDEGKVLISGPSSTGGIKEVIAASLRNGIDLTLVDGALSRLSLASPSVTEAMILSTGAAVSTHIPDLVKRTKALYRLIKLPTAEDPSLADRLENLDQGVYGIDGSGSIIDLELQSALSIPREKLASLQKYGILYVSGAVNNNLLEQIRIEAKQKRLIARDFTRIFASDLAIDRYERSGGKIEVLYASTLIAITVNPQSPSGAILNSDRLRSEMTEALGIPVYDVKHIG